MELSVPAIFWPDVGRLAGSGDRHASGAASNQLDDFEKRIAQSLGNELEGLGFTANDLPRVIESIRSHRERDKLGKEFHERILAYGRANSMRSASGRATIPATNLSDYTGRTAKNNGNKAGRQDGQTGGSENWPMS